MVTEFIRVCEEKDIKDGELKEIEIEGRLIALAKYDGVIYAVDNICTHDGGTLSQGAVVKGMVQCPRHGARFDLKTGQVIRMPAVIPIGTYEVKIENGEVLLAIPK